MKKTNYLNNKDILKEIHKSKKTYCTYTKPEYSDYDIILGKIEEFLPSMVLEGREARATRLAKLAHEEATKDGTKAKLADFAIDPETIPFTDIIFRVTTWEHIPIDAAKQAKADAKAREEFESSDEYNEEDEDIDLEAITGETKYIKLNFPPFYHFKLDECEKADLTWRILANKSTVLWDELGENPYKPVIVGKSHWKGTVSKGHFCKDHGQMTDKLAHMFLKLCERYGTRGNWRGYTYNDEMRGQALLQLSQIGLQFDEAKSQNPFAYYTAAITNSFTRVLNIEKRNQNIRDDILEMNDMTPSFTRQLQHDTEHFNRIQSLHLDQYDSRDVGKTEESKTGKNS